jgi:ribosomal protein S12 methylthiotransferase
LYGRLALPELLEALHAIEGLEWIRIMYFYPTETNRELLATMARLPKVVKYVDIPIQHSHPDVLKSMARPLSPEKQLTLIREMLPQAAIRSTFIVGFPGETEEQFEHLCQFIEEHRFDRLGVFTYSKQTEVPSGHMENQIPERVKKARRKRIMEIQHRISSERNNKLVGNDIAVLIEGFDDEKGHYHARSQWDAPQIDNQIYILSKELDTSLLGEIVTVRVTAAKPYDLFAEFIDQPESKSDIAAPTGESKSDIGVTFASAHR